MTKTQTIYFKYLTTQMIDYNDIIHKNIIIKHLERIPDHKLETFYEKLLEDKLTKKKGFISMITFVNLAEIEVQKYVGAELASLQPKIDLLYDKREMAIKQIQNMTIQDKYNFIEKVKEKKAGFGTQENPFFDELELFVIEKQFGWNSFLDDNNNYLIKEEITKGFKFYLMQKYMLPDNDVKRLT